MIPKRLIYCWFGNKEFPKEFQEYKETWIKYNPDFEILEINESNFDINCIPFVQKAYDLNKMAFVSDVARIWAVNKYGGIYLDVDVEVRKSLKGLLTYHQFWAKEDVGLVNSGLIFGSEKEDPVLKEILNKYSELKLDENRLGAISTVHVVSDVLKKYGLKNDKKDNLLGENRIIFSPTFFAPLHYWGGGTIRDNSITVHHYQKNPTWTKKQNSLLYYLIHELMYLIPAFGVFARWLKKKRFR
jgi:hypothetical protein